MKNHKLSLSLLLITALVSCQEKGIEPDERQQIVPMSFAASVEAQPTDSPATRTSIIENNTVQWNSTDAISIFDVNVKPKQDARFDLKKSFVQDDETGEFEITSYDFVGNGQESEIGYYGLYPYQDCSSDDEYGLFIDTRNGNYLNVIWAGYHQNATIGTFDPEKALLLAYTPAEQNSLNFKQVFAFIKITVTFPLREIDIRGYSDASHNNMSTLAAHSIELLMDENDNPVIRNPKQTKHDNDGSIVFKKNTETILATENSTLFPGTYLIAVIPQTLGGGLEIEFKGIESSQSIADQIKSTTKTVTLERGRILDMGSFSTESFIKVGEWEGDGTAGNPYQITSVEQWNLLAERVNGSSSDKYKSKCYKLMNDINCGGKVLSPIGMWYKSAFEGVLDGDGKTISNYVAGRAYYGTGLFGYIKNATIRNLSVRPAGMLDYEDICHSWTYSPLVAESGTDDEDKWVILDNCHVLRPDTSFSLHFSSEDVFCGSILGISRGNLKILNCTNEMDLTVTSQTMSASTVAEGAVGGIIGGMWLYDDDNFCVIDRCSNTGNISLNTNAEGYAGGIIGCDIDDDFEDVTLRLTNCMNTGNVYVNYGYNQNETFMDAYAGGIVGYHNSDGDSGNGDPFIYNCLNTGNVYACQADSYSGGILGYCYDDDTDVYNCANTGKVTAGNSPKRGGICGSDDGTYFYCHWSCDLSYMLDGENGGTGCSKMTSIDAATMNGKLTNIPSSSVTYVNWSGEGQTLHLVL